MPRIHRFEGSAANGRWSGNIFIEQLWRTLEYEAVCLDAYDTVNAAVAGIERCFTLYNIPQSLSKAACPPLPNPLITGGRPTQKTGATSVFL